ncbi:MAG TPA: tol-pal system protein YbgF [Hyphomicrobiaceae bacterium]|nr:tol-pal system protein YbgF [Hyphomicrobiaceae bacterium]
MAVAMALPGSVVLAQGPRPVGPTGGKAAAAATAREAPATADAGLLRRVEQLEEQLVDMQVMVGTLESLARGVPAPAPRPMSSSGPAMSGSDMGRLDALETQIRAMAAQLESIQEQLRGLGDRRGANPPSSGFGAVTVAPAAPKDDLDRVFPATSSNAPAPAAPLGGGSAESDTPPQQLYERAYGYLLQKDYSTAETTFEDFLKRHPDHQLAGNAQYWLGETFYVRGQYRPAAAAFLKGYQDYAKSLKAPESLLKLAMSLQRLGRKDAACSSFTEFATKYPTPPAHIRSLAQQERQRSGC